jgi:hypothetical protein
MYEGEAYCPKCRSPRLEQGQKASGIGLGVVILIIVLGCVGTVLKLIGVI